MHFAIHSDGQTTTKCRFVNESNRWYDISGRLLWTHFADMLEISKLLLNHERTEGFPSHLFVPFYLFFVVYFILYKFSSLGPIHVWYWHANWLPRSQLRARQFTLNINIRLCAHLKWPLVIRSHFLTVWAKKTNKRGKKKKKNTIIAETNGCNVLLVF